MTTLTTRVIKTAGQVVVLGAALWFLVRTAQPNWGTLTNLPQRLAWAPLLAGSALWLGSYSLLVQLWATSLRWWGARLAPFAALRVFFLANLARYIPGAIWQFTGLAALALEQGLAPAAAAGAMLMLQVLLLASGLLLALGLAPAFVTPLATALPPAATALLAGAGFGALMVVFPVLLPILKGRIERVTGRPVPLPHPSALGFAAYLVGSALAWAVQGIAFWLFARSLLGVEAPGLLPSGGAYVASNVAGVIAVFAPGGLVVREAALVAALGPLIGAPYAFLLAVGSRVWLTTLEILGTLCALAVAGRRRGQGLRSTKTN